MNETPDRLAELLQDGTWLRRFVARLVAPQDVDDVVQATQMAALATPVVPATSMRAWLAGIGRNLARMLHRSRARGRRAIANLPASVIEPPAADVVADLEVRQAVGSALLALAEPTRTMLVLHYQHGLEPEAIGARFGLTSAAVRQRLHRGREEVRVRLRQRFGANWRGSLAVLTFVGRDPVRPATASGMVACAAVLAIATGTTFLVAATSGVDAQPAGSTMANGVTSIATEAIARPVDMAIQERDVVRELVASAQDPKPSPTESTFTIRGRLVAAESGAPLQGTLWRKVEAKLATAADGTFAVPVPSSRIERESTIWIDSEGRSQRWFRAQPKQDLDLGDIPMSIGYPMRARVVDEAGVPMAKFRVEVRIAGEFPSGGVMGCPNTTDENGWFAFQTRLLPAGETKLYAGTDGFELLDGRIRIEPPPAANEFVLHAAQRRSIRGHVFTADGLPCSEVEIEAAVPGTPSFTRWLGVARSLADGSFELFQRDGGDEPVSIRGTEWSSHEVIDAGPTHAWGASGVRVVMRARTPIHLQVICAEDGSPVERFGVDLSHRHSNGKGESATSVALGDWPAGRVDLGRLAKGVRVEVWPEDPMLAPVDLVVDEAHGDQKEILVHVHRLVPFQLTLSDARGAPVAAECWLLDRCGAQPGDGFRDYRANRHQAGGRSTLRVSTTKTDATGKATLMAPITTRELVLEVRQGKQKHWLPVQPSKAVTTLRVVVPD